MKVNVFCYGKRFTGKTFDDMKKAKAYLKRKKKDGFIFVKHKDGDNSDARYIFDNSLSVWIKKYN